MSGIRKARRARQSGEQPAEPARMTRAGILLTLGLIAAVLGGLWGGYCYQVYGAGRESQILYTELGNFYLPEMPPGDAGYGASAYVSFAIAGVGIVVSAASLAVIGARRLVLRSRPELEPPGQGRQGSGYG